VEDTPDEYDVAYYYIKLIRGAASYVLTSFYLDELELVLLDPVYAKTTAYADVDCVEAMAMGDNEHTQVGYGDFMFGNGTASIAVPA
jgi:hypothetical protein